MKTKGSYTDQELVHRLRNGDEATMKQVFDTYYSRLHYFSTRIIQDQEDAEDIVQEAFLNFWVNIREKETGLENIQAYLFRMVRNRCLNYLERQSTVSRKNGDVIAHLQTQWKSQLDEQAVREEVLHFLSRELIHLTPIQMQVIQMLYLEGLSVAEVAEQLNTTANNIRVHKARAIERLKTAARTDLLSLSLFFILFFEFAVMKCHPQLYI